MRDRKQVIFAHVHRPTYALNMYLFCLMMARK